MNADDEAARKARAKQLHGQIEKLVGGSDSSPAAQEMPVEDTPVQPAPSSRESPREFIQRRMRELKEKEHGS
jgi:hypothetical protein